MTKTQLWLYTLRTLVGVREIGGQNKGPHVEQFIAHCKLPPGSPYCLAALAWATTRVDLELGGEPSKLPVMGWTIGLAGWAEKHGVLLREPRVGSIVLWRKGETAQGHAGAVLEVMEHDRLRTVEFNTAGAGAERDGDGCYELIRPIPLVGDLRVLGYVKPWEES